MKAFSVLTLALIIIAATLFKSIAVVAFHINKEKVVTKLCVQRKAAENNCQGSCYLKEKLGLNKDVDQPQKPAPTFDFQDIVFLRTKNLFLKPKGCIYQQNFTPYVFVLKSNLIFNHWHPPRFV